MNDTESSTSVFLNSEKRKCSKYHNFIFELEFLIGTKYLVCPECSELPCFSRFLKTKKRVLLHDL